MALYHFLILISIILILGYFVFYLITKGENLHLFLKIAGIGAIGWTLAFFIRLIPLQLVQLYFITRNNPEIDLMNTQAVNSATIALNVLIWGPLFAGIFESGFRYIFLSKNFKTRETMTAVMIFGLGWGVGEAVIIILYSLLQYSIIGYIPSLDIFSIIVTIIERSSATLLHISLAVVVYFAIYEKWPKSSLWLAMLTHFLFDDILLVWIFNSGKFIGYEYIVSLEATILIISILISLFVFNWYVPRKTKDLAKVIILKNELDQQKILHETEMKEKIRQQMLNTKDRL